MDGRNETFFNGPTRWMFWMFLDGWVFRMGARVSVCLSSHPPVRGTRDDATTMRTTTEDVRDAIARHHVQLDGGNQTPSTSSTSSAPLGANKRRAIFNRLGEHFDSSKRKGALTNGELYDLVRLTTAFGVEEVDLASTQHKATSSADDAARYVLGARNGLGTHRQTLESVLEPFSN